MQVDAHSELFLSYPKNHFMWNISTGGGTQARSQLSSLVFITYPITSDYVHVRDVSDDDWPQHMQNKKLPSEEEQKLRVQAYRKQRGYAE